MWKTPEKKYNRNKSAKTSNIRVIRHKNSKTAMLTIAKKDKRKYRRKEEMI